MESTKRPGEELFLDKVRQARQMSFEDKLLAGRQLFESVCRRMKDGIRMQFPDASEDDVHRILRERLEINRQLEDRPR